MDRQKAVEKYAIKLAQRIHKDAATGNAIIEKAKQLTAHDYDLQVAEVMELFKMARDAEGIYTAFVTAYLAGITRGKKIAKRLAKTRADQQKEPLYMGKAFTYERTVEE